MSRQDAILLTTPRGLGQQTEQKWQTPEGARAAKHYSLSERPPTRQFSSPCKGDVFGGWWPSICRIKLISPKAVPRV